MDSVSDAAESGDQLKLLYAIRKRLALAVDDERCLPRDIPPLTRRLEETAKTIAILKERLAQEGKGGDIGTGSASDSADEWDPRSL